jgi:crossover junction endodeoxyribonuclease RusA
MTITLPLPPTCLQPNRVMRLHWAKRHRAVAKARGEAALLARMANDRQWTNPELRATFYLRDKRRVLDQDGAIGWLKSYQDGIADALGINDRRMRISAPVQLIDKDNPRVEIEIVEAADYSSSSAQ